MLETASIETKKFEYEEEVQDISAWDINLDLEDGDRANIGQKSRYKTWRGFMMDNHDKRIQDINNYLLEQPLCFANPNYKWVFRTYKNAAEFGNPYGQYNLVLCYYRGWGCEKSIEKAAEWLSRAIVNGHPLAERQLKNIISLKAGTKCLPF